MFKYLITMMLFFSFITADSETRQSYLTPEARAQGFVYLDEIDPTIQVLLRYATSDNFVGKPLPGYEITDRAIITRQTACALKEVQTFVQNHGYCLVVYDAYRPQQTVDYFIQWAQDYSDQLQKSTYYPYINKEHVFDLRYVAGRSGHSRGSTVDITLIKNDQKLTPIIWSQRILLNTYTIPFLDDGTIDMGSSWDLFDVVSHFDNDYIPMHYKILRTYLRRVMIFHGFKPIEEEWWHFTLEYEPFPDTYFNFPVK